MDSTSQARAAEREDDLPFRQAPHNIEAEQALIGAILVNNDAYFRVMDFLEPEHFFEPVHGRIYDIAGQLIRATKLASPITLKTFFGGEELVPGVSAQAYLARLAGAATTVINAADYGRAIYDLAIRRNLILIGEDMVNVAFDAPVEMPPQAQIEDAEQRLFELAERGKYGSGFLNFSTALTHAVDMAAAAYQRDGGLSGLATGFRDLDRMMGGLQSSDLVIIAGRPSMGKTALATNIAYNVASKYRTETDVDGSERVVDGAVVGFFSLEMSAEQLATRLIAQEADVPSNLIRRGKIDESQFTRLQAFAQQMQNIPLYIDPTGGITVAQLAARARRLKRQRNMGLIIVDYLQLLSGSRRRAAEGRVQEVSEITTSLKALAKELNVPIVALSQLSRQVESREDKRPQLSDLRESGSIEQDADIVMFVYREEYYDREPKPGTSEHLAWKDKQIENLAEVIIGKQRHGPIGTVKLHFVGDKTQFSDLAEEDRLPDRMD
jgi:replicative DNA helicase